jgi:hypothetical protein
MSDVHRLSSRALDRREVFFKWSQPGKDCEQRWPGHRFDHEATPFRTQDRFVTRQLQVARNAEGLVPTVLEETDDASGRQVA